MQMTASASCVAGGPNEFGNVMNTPKSVSAEAFNFNFAPFKGSNIREKPDSYRFSGSVPALCRRTSPRATIIAMMGGASAHVRLLIDIFAMKVFVRMFGQNGELLDSHLFFFDRYSELADYHGRKGRIAKAD